MGLLSYLFSSRSAENDEAELMVFLQKLETLNQSISDIAALASSQFTVEVNLDTSINEALYLLDSEEDNRVSEFKDLSSAYGGRSVEGKLQRIEKRIEEIEALFADLESQI